MSASNGSGDTTGGGRADEPSKPSSSVMKSSSGWDGKLRVNKSAVLANPEALSDPEYSDEDAPPVEQIAADEDLLDDYPEDEEDIDLVHRGIVSIPALKLERFKQVKRLCLRQNQISHLTFPDNLIPTLEDLDLYDNLIGHTKNLDHLTSLTFLDLSFNKIKHIKSLEPLIHLTDLYFVQNKISRIEGVSAFKKLRNLELGANRIRVIENLDALANSLQELWLGKNKIARLENLAPLSNLRILSIQANRLTTLGRPKTETEDGQAKESTDGDELPLAGLVQLEELYVSHNAIEAIGDDDLAHNPKLRVIDISNNRISALNGFKQLTQLEEFWASNNQLASFREVEEQLADKKSLETVYLEGNPLQTDNEVLYRNKVRLALPQVKQIDATFVHVS